MKRIFIANRGEICRRIACTARRLGIETVAAIGRELPPAFLSEVVTAFARVPDETPASWLDVDRLVALARESGCDAIHPGFGFLSEKAEFAEACVAAGLAWIGPRAAAIRAMASKTGAREIARRSGVPLVPSFEMPRGAPGGEFSGGAIAEAAAFARAAGLPVIVKAALGGGGKGMRLVHEAAHLSEACLRAASEAESAFGDGTLVIEKYLANARHVEVQVMGDRHGHLFVLGDRDCSLQRRHQKIIEECPAPDLPEETRRGLHATAHALAAAVEYDSAGTVEFLVDASAAPAGGRGIPFYFLEMNTRLQVEHPVTEEVWGVDMVELQIRSAGGRVLDDLPCAPSERHCVEARLYAEDPAQGFMPAPGPMLGFTPGLAPGVRWEVGIDPVDEVSARFDPMVGKVVATGPSRRDALQRLAEALSRTFFAVGASNLEFLRALAEDPRFMEGPLTTGFLGDHAESVVRRAAGRRDALTSAADEVKATVIAPALQGRSLGAAGGGAAAITRRVFSADGLAATPSKQLSHGSVSLLESGVRSAAGLPGREVLFGRGNVKGSDGRTHHFVYAAARIEGRPVGFLAVDGVHFPVSVRRRSDHGAADAGHIVHDVVAPVPGKVVAVRAEPGGMVEKGTSLFVLESMKMEFEVRSPRQGTIAGILVKNGDQVAAGQRLADFTG